MRSTSPSAPPSTRAPRFDGSSKPSPRKSNSCARPTTTSKSSGACIGTTTDPGPPRRPPAHDPNHQQAHPRPVTRERSEPTLGPKGRSRIFSPSSGVRSQLWTPAARPSIPPTENAASSPKAISIATGTKKAGGSPSQQQTPPPARPQDPLCGNDSPSTYEADRPTDRPKPTPILPAPASPARIEHPIPTLRRPANKPRPWPMTSAPRWHCSGSRTTPLALE